MSNYDISPLTEDTIKAVSMAVSRFITGIANLGGPAVPPNVARLVAAEYMVGFIHGARIMHKLGDAEMELLEQALTEVAGRYGFTLLEGDAAEKLNEECLKKAHQTINQATGRRPGMN